MVVSGVNMMKNTVIFDLDGLLIDSEVISYRVYRDLTEMYGEHMSIETYIHDYSGKTSVRNMQTLLAQYRLPVSMEEGTAFTEQKEKEYFEQGVELKRGAAELLSYLKRKQYKILLASSSDRERAIGVLSRKGIGVFFDDMVFGTEVKRGKPYPDIFLKACECAKEPPENCLVLEDSEAGIQAALAAGIDVVCIPDMKEPGGKFREMTAAVLPSLESVISWLEQQHIAKRSEK